MMQTLIDLDIREGDILTISGRDYPIKRVFTFRTDGFSSASFARMAKATASVSRNISDGQGNYPRTLLVEGMPCTSLDPLSGREESEYRATLNAPVSVVKTYAASANGFYKLFVEDLKK